MQPTSQYNREEQNAVQISIVAQNIEKTEMSKDQSTDKVILSTPLVIEPGRYDVEELTEEQARAWVRSNDPVNFCTHETVRRLGIAPAETRRSCESYREALAIKPEGRPAFGREYTNDEINEIGLRFLLIRKQSEEET